MKRGMIGKSDDNNNSSLCWAAFLSCIYLLNTDQAPERGQCVFVLFSLHSAIINKANNITILFVILPLVL